MAAEGFRLEQVLRVARSKEEQAQQHLAQLAAERELARTQLRALREQEWQQLTALRERGQVGSLDPSEHDHARAYLERLASWIVERAGQVAAVEEQVSASRGELLVFGRCFALLLAQALIFAEYACEFFTQLSQAR